MTILTWPNLSRAAPGEMEWSLVFNTQSFQSPLSGAVQTVEMPGARWRVVFTLHNLAVADTAVLRAWLSQLRGQAGRFYLHDFARPLPRGTARGTALVAGASQTGTTLNVDGMTAGATLLPGDLFEVSGELKQVVATATADGAGAMAITFEPPLRASPADNATVTLESPKAIFRLEEDVSRVVTRAPLISDIAIAATEAWS